ncbi:MAG: RidA family protein [Candidatus Eisenbacteria bacterium]|uniref:RidA family protein n=1 Tax=Eiseniibacteriota bacterium TaxID=2212470 RepID=A0A538SCM5_UNCEI|nr:MAG: RidA family protein [Candidatus Eisenbacteria bacterium]TMQ56825.1 MAG: RidA family protein [Candidatus Eisenbacteria bacterium]
MTRKPESILQTPHAPAAIGPYAQGRTGPLTGRWLVSSGQVGLDPASGSLVPGGIGPETERALRNLEAVLKAGNATFQDVVKTTVFLADMADFAAMNEIYGRFFPDPKPARSTVAVNTLPRDARVEIEVWAFLT